MIIIQFVFTVLTLQNNVIQNNTSSFLFHLVLLVFKRCACVYHHKVRIQLRKIRNSSWCGWRMRVILKKNVRSITLRTYRMYYAKELWLQSFMMWPFIITVIHVCGRSLRLLIVQYILFFFNTVLGNDLVMYSFLNCLVQLWYQVHFAVWNTGNYVQLNSMRKDPPWIVDVT